MTIVKGNFGGGQGSSSSMDNVDLTHAKTLECEECKCQGFKQTLMLKRLSALVSPTGREVMVPVAVFACEKCSHINQEFLDADITGV